jgi:hypothetical protein
MFKKKVRKTDCRTARRTDGELGLAIFAVSTNPARNVFSNMHKNLQLPPF